LTDQEKDRFEDEEVQISEDESASNESTAPNVSELGKLKEENALLFTRLQRLQADFDNFRKRVKAEKGEWNTQALSDLVRELLPVIDNLERAKDAAGSAEALASGVDLVYRQFVSVLEKQGLSTIEACGTEFDPNCHHAIMQVECEEPENKVVEEMQKGYRLNERVLRPSMVKVAK
jgi:molecular chaperone GrpE